MAEETRATLLGAKLEQIEDIGSSSGAECTCGSETLIYAFTKEVTTLRAASKEVNADAIVEIENHVRIVCSELLSSLGDVDKENTKTRRGVRNFILGCSWEILYQNGNGVPDRGSSYAFFLWTR